MQQKTSTNSWESLTGDISSFLFKSKSSKEPRPFENIPDLGRSIAALPEGSYAGKDGVVTSFLRQVFNGIRPCPPEYLEAIIAATRQRFAERKLPGNLDMLSSDLEKGIQALRRRRERRDQQKQRVSSKHVKSLGSPALRFAVNPPLTEMRLGSSDHRRITSHIMDDLALAEQEIRPKSTYKICFPVETDAVDLWRQLFDELVSHLADHTQAADNVTGYAAECIQNAEATNRLQIYIVPYYLCLASALIDNPDNRDECRGVLLQVEKGGDVKLYEIPERSVGYWRQMYYDLENQAFGDYRRLEFSRFRKLVMQITPAY